MARSARWLISALTVAVVVALGEVHAHLIGFYRFTALPRFAWLLVFLGLLLVAFYAAGLPESATRFSGGLVRSFAASVAAAAAVSVMALVVGSPLLPRFVVFLSVAALTPLVAAVSVAAQGASRKRGAAERVVAVVGQGEALALAADLRLSSERPALLVATCSPAEAVSSRERPHALAELVEVHGATLVVLDREALGDEDIVVQVAELHRRGVRVRTLSLFYDQWLGKVPLSELERSALLFDIHELHDPAYARVKRACDVAVAVAGLPVLAAAAAAVWLLDRVGNRGPLLFRQERVGKDGRTFVMLKFRTMPPGNADASWTAADDRRVGRVGRLLRRSHVDELPQLVNVLRRELSIVGPRPEQPRYVAELARKIDYYDLRHLVLPGMTGWAQVKFAYGSSGFDALEKLQYEFYYLRHQSLLLDLRIVGRTLRSIVDRGGR